MWTSELLLPFLRLSWPSSNRGRASRWVVATVSSLGGEEIEPYANELFRTWKLGERTKNNGVLLQVAEWRGAVDTLVAHCGSGHIADGFISAIDTCGTVLAAYFLRTAEGRDELPDRIYVT